MALISISVIPFGTGDHVFGYNTFMQLTDLNVGVLFMLARQLDGRVWDRAGGLVVEQQIQRCWAVCAVRRR